MANSPDTAVLFVTHVLPRGARRELLRIARADPERHETHLLLDVTHGDPAPLVDRLGTPCHRYTTDELHQLGYPMIGDTVVPGHAHFPLMKFFREHRPYDYYWLIEYDVRYRGRWADFFAQWHDDPSDMLTCRVRSYAEEPGFPWWKLTHPTKTLPPEERVHSFNPIHRLSRRALELLHDEMLDGWSGHQEVIVPTLLAHHGYRVTDFADPSVARRPCYTTHPPNPGGEARRGTMRFRPLRYTVGWRRDTLYHPVKGPVSTFRQHVRTRLTKLRALVGK